MERGGATGASLLVHGREHEPRLLRQQELHAFVQAYAHRLRLHLKRPDVAQTKQRPTEGECSEGRRSCFMYEGSLQILGLPLKRSHVAHRAVRLRSWFTALVLIQFAVDYRNVVDGNAVSTKRVGHGRATVIGKVSEF